MSDVPLCMDCKHREGLGQCSRPVPSYWNGATGQRRSRVAASIESERSDRKVWGGGRERCGPEGQFFEPKDPIGMVPIFPE